MSTILDRADAFCARFGLRIPILLAPMGGASPPALSVAVASAGALGACGALLMRRDEIAAWADAVRAETDGPFQMNLWTPDPEPARDAAAEARVRAFLGQWGPPVPPEAGDITLPDFDAQCEALLAVKPAVVSSIMGLYPPPFVARLKERGIAWFAVATTLDDGRRAVLVLEVIGRDFPSTIPDDHWHPDTKAMVCKPRGGTLSLHVAAGTDSLSRPCEWMGEGGRCDGGDRFTYAGASRFYRQHGNPQTVLEQDEAFWVALEHELEAWTKEQAA